jgi:tRNA1Val (adenine37-N6)-methyltransferase
MNVFQFKHFNILQNHSAQKVGTDSMLLGALANWKTPKNLLDIGTGTGVLALMCAQRFPFELVVGVELSEQAYIDAEENFINAPFSSTFQLVNQSILDFQYPSKFDAIISNPPYFDNSLQNSTLEKTQARHTTELSLIQLISCIENHLSETGSAWIVLPFDQQEKLEKNLFESALKINVHCTIYGNPTKAVRIIVQLCWKNFASEKTIHTSIQVRELDGTYSEAYKKLTHEYHNKPI